MQTFENLLLDSWASVSMFYIDGIDFDKAEIYTQAGSRAVVRIPAHREQGGRNYHTAFSVECVRQQDATWLVTKVAFLGRKGESAPPILEVTSMPTTNPSDAPAADR